VYKPTKDFPIVFAIHNFSKGWKYRPSVLWDISSWDTTRDKPINIASDGTIGVNPFLDPKRNYGPPPPDTYLAINSSNKLTQEILHLDPPVVAGPMYFLNFRLDLDQGWECAGPVNRSKHSWEAKHPWVEAGRIIFSLNSTTGVDAKVIADNSCAQLVGTIGILGENQTGCPILANPNPAKEHCAFKVDDSVAQKVSEWFSMPEKCKNPGSRMLYHRCESPNKVVTSRGWQTRVPSNSLVVTVGSVFWLFLVFIVA
jgi:hypothetical protein